MPAILTHDFFGQDVYAAHSHVIGKSIDEKDAFLLGNQGPDPLFYLVLSPSMKQFFGLGSAMHHDAPSKLIAALKESLQVLEEHELPVGRAYALGFLCHYALDSTMHPLVYCHERALCDAGGRPAQGRAGRDRGHRGQAVKRENQKEKGETACFSLSFCARTRYNIQITI